MVGWQDFSRIWWDNKTFVQEEKSSASRKLIQPDLLAMSQLLNFDEVTWFAHIQGVCLTGTPPKSYKNKKVNLG